LLPIGLLLLWFYTVWQSYVIEGTYARLAGLEEIWRETLSLDPAWQYCAAVSTVHSLLDSSKRRLARLSLASLFIAPCVPSRTRDAARVRVYESLSRLPSTRLQQDAVSIVETVTRYVVLAALKRSLLPWVGSPLFLAAFVVWSVRWQVRIALADAPQASLQLARLRLRRKIFGPLVGILASSSPM
jgi:hypothetical protein